jgi:hypothetical protein
MLPRNLLSLSRRGFLQINRVRIELDVAWMQLCDIRVSELQLVWRFPIFSRFHQKWLSNGSD